jgi:hypothetical protein
MGQVFLYSRNEFCTKIPPKTATLTFSAYTYVWERLCKIKANSQISYLRYIAFTFNFKITKLKIDAARLVFLYRDFLEKPKAHSQVRRVAIV